MDVTWKSRPSPRPATLITAAMLAAIVMLAIAGGCTSDDPNPVGAGLEETGIDTVLQMLTIDQIIHQGALDVAEAGAPLDETEVLYIGGTGADATSILANYDFSVFDHPDSAYLQDYLTPENIGSAEIRMSMLTWYNPYHGNPPAAGDTTYSSDLKEWLGASKYYDVHQLDAPFDTLSFPGAEPAFAAGAVSSVGNEPGVLEGDVVISCNKDVVADWLQQRQEVGVVIREGLGSQPGLLGFASKEMVHGGSTLDPQNASVTLGPALRILLYDQPAEWVSDRQYLVIGPRSDISTWHELEDPDTGADGEIMVRTHLRSYPVVRFDLDALPDNVRINRANLVVYNDTTRSLGHKTVLTCSEIAPEFAPTGITRVELADIEPEIYFLAGSGLWEPEHIEDHELKFNVTTSLQRYLNDAYDGDRGFLLAAGEYFFTGWNSNPDPDFWFSKWVFFGPGADPDRRPRLEVSYTRLDDLTGGEAQR